LTLLAAGSAFAQGGHFDGYDLTRFGLYTGTGGSITCSTTASSTRVSCPGGVGDFAVGQGIEIPLAGVASRFAAALTTTYVHSVNFTCGITEPAFTLAGKASLGAAGLSANQFTANQIDLIGGAVPSIPSALFGRVFLNSSTNTLGCLNSDGSSCLPLGGSVTHTLGSLPNNQVLAGNGGGNIRAADLDGDCSTSGTLTTNCAKIRGNFLIHREMIAAAGNNNGVCSTLYSTSITPTVHAGSNVTECQIPMADGDAVQPPPILLPLDWTGAVDVGILFSDASTSGTVIFNVATACSPVNGTATDDTAFNTPQALGTITLKRPANGQWLATITGITLGA
jgi:hypothetical protein